MFKKNNTERQIQVESEFTDLSSLVWAPIDAVAQSNLNINRKIIEAVEATGTKKPIIGEKITILDYMGLQYKHVKSNGDEEAIEDMLLQVPLLSIVPLTSMKVKDAVIDFNAEVRSFKKEDQTIGFEARICAPEVRESDNISKVHFKIRLENEPITEGLARVQDIMDLQQITRSIGTKPISDDGQEVTGEERVDLLEKRRLKKLYDKTIILGRKIDELIHHQILYFNALLLEETQLNIKDYEEFKTLKAKDTIRQQDQSDALLNKLLALDEKIKQETHTRHACTQQENQLLEQLLALDQAHLLKEA